MSDEVNWRDALALLKECAHEGARGDEFSAQRVLVDLAETRLRCHILRLEAIVAEAAAGRDKP